MPIVYRKSAKGIAEIETRAHRLAPRARSMLILVDGKRDSEDLKSLIAVQAEETLQSLLELGFIEVVGETLRAAPPPAPPVAAAPAAAYASGHVEFEALRRAAGRALNDTLGPAAESLAIRMEKARDTVELLPLLAQAVKMLSSSRGQAAAADFAARFIATAPPPPESGR